MCAEYIILTPSAINEQYKTLNYIKFIYLGTVLYLLHCTYVNKTLYTVHNIYYIRTEIIYKLMKLYNPQIFDSNMKKVYTPD